MAITLIILAEYRKPKENAKIFILVFHIEVFPFYILNYKDFMSKVKIISLK